MKKLLLIFTIFATSAMAQELQFQQEQYPFPVTFYGVEPQMGFMNSSSYYHHDFGDVDNDGDYDLIIGADFNREYLFKNAGTSQEPEFQFVTYNIVNPFSINAIYQAPCFCDIDNDDDLDIFIGDKYGPIIFYENIGTPDSSSYVLADSCFFNINVQDGPSIDLVDIDSDGDYDLFIGVGWSQQNGRLYFYRNNGNPEEPIMNYITDYFEGIDVGEESSPEFCDIDSDGDYDLFVGCEEGNVWYYENIGDSVNYDFQLVTSNYFNIDVGNMSVPRFCDIDADGDFDLFVANESVGSGVTIEGDMTFYENTGTAVNPQFTFVTSQYLFMDMSSCSSPAAVDIDADGLIELLVGICPGKVVLLENDGTAAEPSFNFADSAFCNLNLPSQPVLSFGDLDSDGDLDMIVKKSGFYSYIDHYENIGSSSHPQFVYLETIRSSWNYSFYGVDLCDIDNDGDLDLFFGSGFTEGYIEYWENIGTIHASVFSCQTTNYLNQTETGFFFPRFADMDDDGDYDLIMGQNWQINNDAFIGYWRNDGTPQSASFTFIETIAYFNYGEISSLRPCLTDVDSDGDLDMFVGEGGGAMLFYRNLEYTPSYTVSVLLTPESTSIQIPPGGGSFSFDVDIDNGDSLNYIIDASTDVTLPSGSPYPLILRPNINLQAGSSISREDLTQFVPANAPAGLYSYNALVLDNNTMQVLAVDSFAFEKLAGEGEALHDYGWELFGWDEPLPLSSLEYPSEVKLYQNVPNPFNPCTVIRFSLPKSGNVKLSVYDLTGREAAVLVDEYRQAGRYEITFDGTDLSNGVYFAKLKAGNITKAVKMLLLK